MKTTHLLFASIIVLFMISCKKIESSTNTNGSDQLYARTASQIGGEKVDINDEFGFLEFKTSSECDAFINNLVGKSHGEVRGFCDNIGFKSLGISKFENINSDEKVDGDQAAIYALNSDGVIGLDKALLKIVNQKEEIETMNVAFIMGTDILNSETYKSLTQGEFNLETMSKLFLGFEINEDLTLFINENSHGYVSPEAPAKSKFWGTVTTSTRDFSDGECTYKETCTVHYIFWIPGKEKCVPVKLYCHGVD